MRLIRIISLFRELAYLNQIGYIDLIITEDSDLIVFGAKTIFYKFDNEGSGYEISK